MMRGSTLRAIRNRVERLQADMNMRPDWDIVHVLQEGRRRAARGEFATMTDDEARQRGRELRQAMRDAAYAV